MFRVYYVRRDGTGIDHADMPDKGMADRYARQHKVSCVVMVPDPAKITPVTFMRAEDSASGRRHESKANQIHVNLDEV